MPPLTAHRRAKRGFTLIELLTVIGIIVILVSMVAFGITKVIDSGKRATTKVALGNLHSMLSEFETTTKGLTRQPAYMYVNDVKLNATPAQAINIWRDGDPTDGTAAPEPDPVPAPVGDVTREVSESGTPPRYNADAVANTELVMSVLRQAPNVKTSLGQLPTSQLMEKIPPGMTPKIQFDPVTRAILNPVVLDGWGNPIIFVPSGGLSGVTFDAHGGEVHIVTSGGVIEPGDPLQPAVRPFFASAGKDGDFTKGDDNMYSFEN